MMKDEFDLSQMRSRKNPYPTLIGKPKASIKRRIISLSILVLTPILIFSCHYRIKHELPFFATPLVNQLALFCVIGISIFVAGLAFWAIAFKYPKPKETRGGKYLAATLFALMVAFFCMIFGKMAINGLLELITLQLGSSKTQPFDIQASVVNNPYYHKIISVPSGKTHRTVIDPSSLVITPTFIINHHRYALPKICFTGSLPANVSSHVFSITGKESILGFACTKDCHINHYITITSKDATPNSTAVCDSLYHEAPNVIQKSDVTPPMNPYI